MVTLWEDPDERGSGCPNILPILTCGSSGPSYSTGPIHGFSQHVRS